jgi:hypothetical protein
MINEYWIVTNNKTGKVICHCADINDAIMMVNFDPSNRVYSRHRFLMDQVIDISSKIDNQLPGQTGLPAGKIEVLNSYKEKLSEGKGDPVIV